MIQRLLLPLVITVLLAAGAAQAQGLTAIETAAFDSLRACEAIEQGAAPASVLTPLGFVSDQQLGFVRFKPDHILAVTLDNSTADDGKTLSKCIVTLSPGTSSPAVLAAVRARAAARGYVEEASRSTPNNMGTMLPFRRPNGRGLYALISYPAADGQQPIITISVAWGAP